MSRTKKVTIEELFQVKADKGKKLNAMCNSELDAGPEKAH